MRHWSLTALLYNPEWKTHRGMTLQYGLVLIAFVALAMTPPISPRYIWLAVIAASMTLLLVNRRARASDGMRERTLTWAAFSLYVMSDLWLSFRFWEQLLTPASYWLWAIPMFAGFLVAVLLPVMCPQQALGWFAYREDSARARRIRCALVVLVPVLISLVLRWWTLGTVDPSQTGALTSALYEYVMATWVGATVTWDLVIYQSTNSLRATDSHA